jgi:hypothetical protein
MGSAGRPKWGEDEKRNKERKRCNLGLNVADFVGEEGLDAGALGEAL